MTGRRTLTLGSLVALIALGTFPTLAIAQPSEKLVRVGVGQSANVTAPRAVAQVHVINPRVADVVRLFGNGATVVGITAGVTEVHFTLATGKVHKVQVVVSAQQVSQLLTAVKDFLGPIEGVYPQMFGDLVIMDGKALTASDYGRVMRAVKLFGEKKIMNFAGYQPSAVDEINKMLDSAGLTTVKANLYGGMVYLEGAVGSEIEHKKVKSLVESLDLKVIDLLTVGKGRQVLIEVKFIELKKTTDINYGLSLPAAITASGNIQGTIRLWGAVQSQGALQLVAPEQSMTAQFNMLFKSGAARVLAKPKLVCGSGGKAKFMVGGEVPIVSCSMGSCSVTFKEFGIIMEVEPTADSLGNVTAKLKAEVSEPDYSLAVLNIPGFIKRLVETTVTMQEGSTLILSGLYTNKMSKTVQKIPLLGHIPILGELFKSRQFQREQTQLAIFITPRIINPQHPWVRRTIQTFDRRYHRFKRKVEWEIFD
jgi:pilus assembly protein CpaC